MHLQRTLPWVLATTALAMGQDVMPFPADITSHDAAAEILEFHPDRVALEALTTMDAVTLTGFPMPDGSAVDLALVRNPIVVENYGMYVDGQAFEYDPLDQTLWSGHIVGNLSSHVTLGLASYGCYGWVHDGGTYTHISSFPSEWGGWANASGRIYSDRALQGAPGEGAGLNCVTDSMIDTRGIAPDPIASGGDMIDPAGGPALDLRISVESDFQYYNNFGNLQACANYTMMLLDAASDRYESQTNVILTFPYLQFHTTSDDGWDSPESGQGCGAVLNELIGAWGGGNVPLGGHLGHFLSGANLGCGVAAGLGNICNPNSGFSVSGNMNGGVTFPVTQGSNTWDFVVFVHEIGHNCGANHTHAYCPPIDTCSDNCTGSTSCSNGTNMSYCHGCGGMSAITTFFHSQIAAIIRTTAENSCIPNYDNRQEVTLFQDDFESGTIGPAWSKQRAKIKTAADYLSTFGVRIRNKGNMTVVVDTTGYDGIRLYYARRNFNLDANEEPKIRYKLGTGSWKTIETVEIHPNHWGLIAVDLPAETANHPAVSIRFKSYGSQGNERMDIDNVLISGRQ